MEKINHNEFHHLFKKSKWIAIKFIFISLLLISFSLYFFINHSKTKNPILIIVSVGTGISFLILIYYIFIKKTFFDDEILIAISNKGMYITAKKQYILWKNIQSIKIDKLSLLSSVLFYGYDNEDIMQVFYKDTIRNFELTVHVQGIENRKTFVALADYYIEKYKNNPLSKDIAQPPITYIFKMDNLYKGLIIGIPIFIISSGLYLLSNHFILGLILIGFGALIFSFNMSSVHHKPIIKLTDEGVWSKKYGIIPWQKINSVKVNDINFFEQILDSDKMYLSLKDEKYKFALIDITGIEKRYKLKEKIDFFLSK